MSKVNAILCLCRDPWRNISALDPEKLKIFGTVREITGAVPLCGAPSRGVDRGFHGRVSLGQSDRQCFLHSRFSQHPVVAQTVQRLKHLLQSHHHPRPHARQVSLSLSLTLARFAVSVSSVGVLQALSLDESFETGLVSFHILITIIKFINLIAKLVKKPQIKLPGVLFPHNSPLYIGHYISTV